MRQTIACAALLAVCAGPVAAKEMTDDFERGPLDAERWYLRQVNPAERVTFFAPGRCSARAVRIVAQPGDVGESCDKPCQRSEVRVAKAYQPSPEGEVWYAFSFRVTGDIPPLGSGRNVVGQIKAPPTSGSPFLAQRIDNGVFHITVESGPARRVIASSNGDPDAMLQAQAFLGRFDRSNPSVQASVETLVAASRLSQSNLLIGQTILAPNFLALSQTNSPPDVDTPPALDNNRGAWLLSRLSYLSEISNYIGYTDIKITPGPRPVLPDPRIKWVDMVYRIKAGRTDNLFGPKREGEIDVWADGEHVVSVRGQIGDQITVKPTDPGMYFKFGVYRDDASYPQSMEFDQFRQSSKPLAPTANCPAPTR